MTYIDDLVQWNLEERAEPSIDVENQGVFSTSQNEAYNVDTAGTTFDPEIHEVGENGKPKRTLTGKFRKKRLKASTKPTAAQEHKDSKQKYQLLGRTTSHTIFSTCSMIMGDEWHPIVDKKNGINEIDDMSSAFAAYYEAKGFNDFPPGVLVAIVVATYAGRRVNQPKTKSRLGKFVGWVKSKVVKKRKKSVPIRENVKVVESSEDLSNPFAAGFGSN